MAIPGFYSLAAFYDILIKTDVRFHLSRYSEYSGMADGVFFESQLASPLWTVDVTLDVDTLQNQREALAKLRSMDGSRVPFFFCDPMSEYPKNDPTGSIMGSDDKTIVSISSDRREITLSGFPANYKFTYGDKLQINYGSPTKYAFHEVSVEATANSGGTVVLTVTPAISPNVTPSATPRFKRPACFMVLSPESFDPGRMVQNIISGGGFKAVQRKKR